jgi:hypothetical protein
MNMMDDELPEIAELDVYAAAFEFAPMVGLTIRPGEPNAQTWLSWDETVELSDWLHKRIAAAVSS